MMKFFGLTLGCAISLLALSPAVAQDGSGSAQRTPESAHSFIGQVISGRTIRLPFKYYDCNKYSCRPNQAVITMLPIRIDAYSHDGPCISKLSFTNVDEGVYRNEAPSMWRSIAITPLSFDGETYKFSTRNVSRDGTLKSQYIYFQNKQVNQIDWTQVVTVTNYGFETTIAFRNQTGLTITQGSVDLAKRLAGAAEFLRLSCDATAATGF